MRRVFLSFLGKGAFNKETKTYGYEPACYTLDGRPSIVTPFVQVAELELLGASSFHKVVIVATEASRDLHFESLQTQLKDIGAVQPELVEITEDMNPAGQWQWFEKILMSIEHGDRLTVDMTHGYRAIPIVFSAAINFLQKAKETRLEGVLYGAYEKDRNLSPIIDMKDFYLINEWAEGVARLVDDADARKLAEISRTTPEFQVGELNDPNLLAQLNDLTNRIRNVDMHNLETATASVVSSLRTHQAHASSVSNLLTGLLEKKFSPLVAEHPPTGEYDLAYFRVQLAYIRMLMEHKLFMQAFTAMRETIGSIGLIAVNKGKIGNAEGRKQRKKADVFINMLQFAEEKWRFAGDDELRVQNLAEFYKKLKGFGVVGLLQTFVGDLVKYRNGFDHGWTGVKEPPGDIEEKGNLYFHNLERVVELLATQEVLK